MQDPLKTNMEYAGNGWSRYQMLVLTQLEDHTELIKNNVAEVAKIKQDNAICANDIKHWQDGVDSKLNTLITDVRFIIYDEKGLNSRLKKIEEKTSVEEKADGKMKAQWAVYGAILVFLIDIGIKLFGIFWK